MKKNFLFLQGPHGPFFSMLADLLGEAGCKVRKICFNSGDRYYWRSQHDADDFLGEFSTWNSFVEDYFQKNAITDIVLYGDAKPFHKVAIEIAKARDIMVHCLEEGYLRPYWVTYERGGSNGYSPLLNMSIDEIRAKRQTRIVDLQDAPSQWGTLWAHKWAGFIYHAAMWLGQKRYPAYQSHRDISVLKEWKLHFLRLINMPSQLVIRDVQTRKFIHSGRPFFAVMLQLEHDMNFKTHSPYKSQKEFIDELVEIFAKFAPKHHYLVFKRHPLDDNRADLKKWVKEAAKKYGVSERVTIFYGGKLGELVNRAKGVLAINSTSVQHALWRGIPVKLLGASVFGKPELVSEQPLKEFFESPAKISKDDYLEYRTFLLETSQIGGGFYTKSGRAEVLRRLADLMLGSDHPYES